MKISFIGYRGTGKTTISRLLAKKLAWKMYDSDDVIQLEQGTSISQMFKDKGEGFFRDQEARVIQELLSHQENLILSTGGGSILRETTRRELRLKSLVVWLKGSEDVIYQRIHKDKMSSLHRPALTELSPLDEIRHVLNIRNPLYEECAQLTVDTDQLEPMDIVQLLLMDPLFVSTIGKSY